MEARRWNCLVTNLPVFLACASPWPSGGGARKRRRACNYVPGIFLQFPCGFPSTELSDFRQSARSGNERECKQIEKQVPRVLMSSPPNSISTQIFKLQRRSCKFSFLLPPRRQSAPERLLAGYCFWHVNDHAHRFVHMGIAWFARK